MLKDITLGQYFPGTTPIHKLDPRVKITATLLYIIVIFIAKSYISYALVIAFLLGCIFTSKIPLKVILKGIKPILWIIAITAILNLFYTDGEPLVQWKIFKISAEGIRSAIMMSLRIIMLIMGTFLLTYTTSPIMLTDAMEEMLGPLKKIKIPVHELAMMMSIALRFIPTLIEETDKIISAQKARGADFESGKLISRAKALIPILVPLFISAFRRADELAVAMECRCYNGGEGRSKMRRLKMRGSDFTGLIISVVFFVVVCLLRKVGP
ncbi:MAG: energy-coupling factor transporter transmembrane protein EcfT [Oscillospiraceae bacterium]|nr:energy-coupling factor transporter transmembrane protein EcfT [Oscillospiraceae bacterium]